MSGFFSSLHGSEENKPYLKPSRRFESSAVFVVGKNGFKVQFNKNLRRFEQIEVVEKMIKDLETYRTRLIQSD